MIIVEVVIIVEVEEKIAEGEKIVEMEKEIAEAIVVMDVVIIELCLINKKNRNINHHNFSCSNTLLNLRGFNEAISSTVNFSSSTSI